MRVKVLFVLVDSIVSSVESGESECCVFQVSFSPVAQWTCYSLFCSICAKDIGGNAVHCRITAQLIGR